MEKQQIIIYQSPNGNQVDVKLDADTVWLTQMQIADLFATTKQNIGMHAKHILDEEELDDSVVKDLFTTAADGKNYNTMHYNLDMIIALGYRVNSKIATAFRRWATNILRQYIIDGYAVNERRLAEQSEKLKMLAQAVDVLKRTAAGEIENLDPMMKELLNVVADFAGGFSVLDNYDHELLEQKGRTPDDAVFIPVDEFLVEVQKAQKQFGGLFGIPKDESFASSVGQIYQSFGGKDLYPTLEEKAANLLYLITKNHSFADGNKRIAATCFLYFMAKNGMLRTANGEKTIDDYAMAALTLLIAQSAPTEKDTMCRLVITILNKRKH